MAKWNVAELAQFLQDHSVVGYPVEVPIFGPGTIDKQIRPEKGGFIFYRVIADNPIPFQKFAEEMGVDVTPMNLAEWREKFVKGVGSFPAIASDLLEQLEAGGKVSVADSLFKELIDRGCIDIDQNVYCHTFPSTDVVLRTPPTAGLGVEVYDLTAAKTGWPGRIVAYSKKTGIVFIEQFAPVPFMEAPEAIDSTSIKKEHALPETWVIGKGTAHTMEDEEGVVLPAGRYSEDGETYLLEGPISLKEFEEVCRRYHPDQPLCLQQAMMLTTLPLFAQEITLRPLPEGTTAADVIVEIGPIPEGEYEHIIWEE